MDFQNSFFKYYFLGFCSILFFSKMMTSPWVIPNSSAKIDYFFYLLRERFKKPNFWWKWGSAYSRFTVKKWQWESTLTGSNSRLIRPEVKKFLNRKSKNIFLESLWKTILRVLFSFFDILSLNGDKSLWSITSCDDVIAGKGLNQKK